MLRNFFFLLQKYERHLSALAMVAGFIVDNIFFERIDLWQTQAVFAVYTLICLISIPLLHFIEERAAKGIARPRWRGLLPMATQFALGGFWSGFFVFYGRAAVLTSSWPFILFIIVVLIGNEYYSRYHERLVFTSVLFFLALYSYSIFAVPVFTRSIGVSTFLLSGALAMSFFAVFTLALRILGSFRFREQVWRIRVGAVIVLVVINVFYFTDILPPLPLSAKAAGVYRSVWRVTDDYMATTEVEPWRVEYLGFSPTIHTTEGEPLYVYASVFAPTALSTDIVHEWQWHNPDTNVWTTRTTIHYPITGGRDGGYRGYSTALVPLDGSWRVNIKTTNGHLIEQVSFKVEKSPLPVATQIITLK